MMNKPNAIKITAGLYIIFFLLCILSASPAFAQTVVYRIDPAPVMTTSGNVPYGGFPAAYVVPNAAIKLCTNSTCTVMATAYTDATGSTPCASSSPVTLPGTNVCTPTAGSQGQFGFWIQPGTYYYTVTTLTGTFGPYPISSPTPSGVLNGPGIVSANAADGIAAMTNNYDCSVFTGASASIKTHACAAALAALASPGGTVDTRNMPGAQTWNTDAFSGITAPIDFLCAATTFTVSANSTIPSNVSLSAGEGCLFSVNSGVTLTVNGNVQGSATQHFGGVGNVVLTGGTADLPRAEWWGLKGDGATDNTAVITKACLGSTRLQWGPGTFLVNPDTIGTCLAPGLSALQSVKWIGSFDNNISSSTSGTTTIKANTSGTTLFKSSVVLGDFQYLTFDGNGEVANVAEMVPNSSWQTYRHVTFINPTPTTGTVVWLDGFNGGSTASEVDSITFDNVHIAGNPSAHAGIGLYVDGSNTFKVQVTKSELDSANYLVKVGGSTGAGGADFNNVQFEQWDTDAVYITNGPTQALSFVSCYSETTAEFINGSGIYSAAGYNPILFEQNQFNANIQLTIWAGQPYVFIGNAFNYLVYLEATKTTGGATSYYIPPTSLGNTFGVGFDWTSNSGHGSDVSEICNYLTANFALCRTTLKGLIGMGGVNPGVSRILIDSEAFTTAPNANASRVLINGANAMTVPTGTTADVQSLDVEQPNLTCMGTCTNASTLRIGGPPVAGTNQRSLWVASGPTALAGTLSVVTLGGATSSALCYNASSTPDINELSTCTSLEETKDIAGGVDTRKALREVMALKPITFKFKQDPGDPNQYGLGAHAVESVDPLLATYYQGKLNGVNFNAVVALLVKTVQEQQRQIETLQKQSRKR